MKAKQNLKRIEKTVLSRGFIVALMIILQLLFILLFCIRLTNYSYIGIIGAELIGVVVVLGILSRNLHPTYKMAWCILVLIFPLFGITLYYIFCGNDLSKRLKRKMSRITSMTSEELEPNTAVSADLKSTDIHAWRQTEYIRAISHCPVYKNRQTEYYPTGESMLEPMLAELEKAEKYIFIEYFILEEGYMWDRIHEVLKRKADSGVDIRIIYDGVGNMVKVSHKFPAKLEREGIHCKVFNKFIPFLDARQNNRDHRKILVIDGLTAFTGGVNIADEYVNNPPRFGYWKDNAVMIKGEAAWSFTVMFLTMWDYLCRTPDIPAGVINSFRPADSVYNEIETTDTGCCQPYTDNPLDGIALGKNIYLNIIANAHDYVWITTPYLIIDDELINAMANAAASGVDVRIIVPGIPDKKIVNELTKSYYQLLIEKGIGIYEFTPGFVHAKTFLSDDEYATVGSVNLDFRSLYLHFECGLWMYRTSSIKDIRQDFTEMFPRCRKITLDDCRVPKLRMVFRSALQVMTPVL